MNTIDKHAWVYIIVVNPGANEQFLGLEDKETKISFIPAFMDKETCRENLYDLPREKGNKHEIQAIIYEDLVRYASENTSLIFMLDGEGKVTDKIDPNGNV